MTESFPVDPRQADQRQQERQLAAEENRHAQEVVEFYGEKQEWPRRDITIVKMMLGLIPSPEPKLQPGQRFKK